MEHDGTEIVTMFSANGSGWAALPLLLDTDAHRDFVCHALPSTTNSLEFSKHEPLICGCSLHSTRFLGSDTHADTRLECASVRFLCAIAKTRHFRKFCSTRFCLLQLINTPFARFRLTWRYCCVIIALEAWSRAPSSGRLYSSRSSSQFPPFTICSLIRARFTSQSGLTT